MVSGEIVPFARKNKEAVENRKWTTPILAAGNYLPDYTENSEQVSRRLAVFPFFNQVQERNTLLKAAVIKTELVAVMMRCLYAYRNACDRFKGADFWKHVASSELVAAREEVKHETNYLANFLQNGSPYYQILHLAGAVTLWSELEIAYSNHCRIDLKLEKAQKIGDNLFPIKDAGYIIDRANICKTCNRKHAKETCGSHYDSQNRWRKVVILDMSIVTKNTPKNLFS
jgi:hypothetical protein